MTLDDIRCETDEKDEMSDIDQEVEEGTEDTSAESLLDELLDMDDATDEKDTSDVQDVDSTAEDLDESLLNELLDEDDSDDTDDSKEGEDADDTSDESSLQARRQKAVREALEEEIELIQEGKGTRDWTIDQQIELLLTKKVSGMEGHHMLNVGDHPEYADDPRNIQFLTYEEHLYGAHDGSFRGNATGGRFDPASGETEQLTPNEDGSLPERKAFALTDTVDPEQVLDGTEHTVTRRDAYNDSKARHAGDKSRGSLFRS